MANGFRITTPGDWVALEPSEIKAGVGGNGTTLPAEMGPALKYIELAADALEASNVVFAAVLARPGAAEALATVASYFVGMPVGGDRLSALEAAVRDNPPTDVVDGSFEVGRATLATGRCVRATGLRRSVLELPSGDSVSFAVEYFLPIPDSADMLVTAFSTPNTAQADQFAVLFAEIIATVEFV